MKVLPRNMKRLGYVVANDNEEYLSSYDISSFTTLSAWALTPALAYVFSTHHEIEQVIKRLPKRCRLWSLEFYETDNNFFVTTDKLIKPVWLH